VSGADALDVSLIHDHTASAIRNGPRKTVERRRFGLTVLTTQGPSSQPAQYHLTGLARQETRHRAVAPRRGFRHLEGCFRKSTIFAALRSTVEAVGRRRFLVRGIPAS